MQLARRGRGCCRSVAALLGALLLALAGSAGAWPHPRDGAGGERRYRDLAQRRLDSVRSSFGARRDLATVSFHTPNYLSRCSNDEFFFLMRGPFRSARS
jgi:hypothetical protein